MQMGGPFIAELLLVFELFLQMGGPFLCGAMCGADVHADLDLCGCHCHLSDCSWCIYLLQVDTISCC